MIGSVVYYLDSNLSRILDTQELGGELGVIDTPTKLYLVQLLVSPNRVSS